VKIQRSSLEIMLLFLALLTCIWGVAGLIRPGLMPSQVSVINVVTFGAIFALCCSDHGPHAVARLAVLAVCFGVECAALLTNGRLFYPFPAAFAAIVSASVTYAVFVKYSKSRQRAAGGAGPGVN
jgi:hypothetical protein